MIIGKGDIASVLNDREGAIFFASGVSNSGCMDSDEFSREYSMLREFYGDKRSLFYFGSIKMLEKRPLTYVKGYYRHKWLMENEVRENFENYNIIRLGNIDWGTNPNTFLNYLKANPTAQIRDEWKYMISKEQLTLITDNLPLTGKNEINIFGDMKKVKDLI